MMENLDVNKAIIVILEECVRVISALANIETISTLCICEILFEKQIVIGFYIVIFKQMSMSKDVHREGRFATMGYAFRINGISVVHELQIWGPERWTWKNEPYLRCKVQWSPLQYFKDRRIQNCKRSTLMVADTPIQRQMDSLHIAFS